MNDTNNLARNAAITTMDQLLSASLDDLDDLPSFDCPPPGVYVVSVSTDQKEVNKKDAIEASYTVTEVIELSDPNSTPPVAGSKFSTLFTLNEYGVGKLKEFAKPFGDKFGTRNVGELVRDHIKDVMCTVSVKNRKDKEDPDKVYPIVKVIQIA